MRWESGRKVRVKSSGLIGKLEVNVGLSWRVKFPNGITCWFTQERDIILDEEVTK